MHNSRPSLPLLTLVVVLATTIGAVAQLADPGVLEALRRDPDALANGEWWRIVSPLFVLDGTLWLHYVADTAVLVVVGATLEWEVGALRWALLFIAGGLAGQALGYRWDPRGAGASVGICGLVGGLAVVQVVDRRLHLVASLFCVGLVAALASAVVVSMLGGEGAMASITVVVACAVLINVLMLSHRRSADPRTSARLVAGVVVVGALVLVWQQDVHGAALLAGLGVGTLLFGAQRHAEAPAGAPS